MENETLVTVPKFARFDRRSFFGVVAAGILSSIVIVTAGRLLDQFVIAPALCRSADQLSCANSDIVSLHIAAVIAGILAVVTLARVSVYRPLLVALTVTAGLWSISTLSLGLTWPWAILVLSLGYILSYLAFGWLLRIYNLIIALILTLALVAAMIIVPTLQF